MQACNLDWVSQRSSRAVRLDIAHRPRMHSRFLQRTRDYLRLRLRVWHGIAVRLPTVVHRRSLDDAVDLIPVRHRLGQRLQQHRTYAFTRHIPISAFSEAFAPPLAGGKLALGQHQVFIRVHRDVHPAGNRQLARPPLQALAGQMEGRQRRGAHRIHRHARPVEVEVVRHPVRHRRWVP
ncbi:hypothetical protein D3C74_381120 [compost metagenome]